MVLYVDKNKKVYGYNSLIQSDKGNSDSVVYEGDFSFEQGENKEGYQKLFYLREGKVEIEYERIPESPEPEPTMNEKIYAAVSKSQDEIRQEGADIVMEEMKKRGLIV